MKLTPSERAAADEALNSAFVFMDYLPLVAKIPLPEGAGAEVWEDLRDMDLHNDEDLDVSMDDVFAMLERVAVLARMAGLEFMAMPSGRSADDLGKFGDAFVDLTP